MTTYKHSLTGGKVKTSWSCSDIERQAYANCLALIRTYNAHALMGEMMNAAVNALKDAGIDPNGTYTQAEAEEFLSRCDSGVREMLDD